MHNWAVFIHSSAFWCWSVRPNKPYNAISNFVLRCLTSPVHNVWSSCLLWTIICFSNDTCENAGYTRYSFSSQSLCFPMCIVYICGVFLYNGTICCCILVLLLLSSSLTSVSNAQCVVSHYKGARYTTGGLVTHSQACPHPRLSKVTKTLKKDFC